MDKFCFVLSCDCNFYNLLVNENFLAPRLPAGSTKSEYSGQGWRVKLGLRNWISYRVFTSRCTRSLFPTGVNKVLWISLKYLIHFNFQRRKKLKYACNKTFIAFAELSWDICGNANILCGKQYEMRDGRWKMRAKSKPKAKQTERQTRKRNECNCNTISIFFLIWQAANRVMRI